MIAKHIAMLLLCGLWAGRLYALDWTVLENCTFLPNYYNDGDSFHVMHDGKEYIFRLYFVDAPETEMSLSDRIREQAASFGITTEDTIKIGHAAAAFTAQQLSTNFTVYTKWHSAQGRSAMPRYYAMVQVGQHELGDMLVEKGLARIFGVRAKAPSGEEIGDTRARLMDLELEAQLAKQGAWQYLPARSADEEKQKEEEPDFHIVTCPRAIQIYSTAEPRHRLGEIERYTKLKIIEEFPDGWVHVGYNKANGDDQEAYCLRWDLNLPDISTAAAK